MSVLQIKDRLNRWIQIRTIKGDTGEGVPEGGTTGQVLKKKSNADYDTDINIMKQYYHFWKIYNNY